MHACFVALNAYPAIEPGAPGTFGGIETRAWQFARGLAEMSDWDVSFVVRHPAPLLRPEVDGVRLILMRDRLYHVRDSLLSRLERRSRFPWIVLRHPRVSDALFLPLLAARKALITPPSPTAPLPFYNNIDADLFLTFGVQSNSATVIASAHATGRPAILFLGSDSDLDERYAESGDFVSVYRDRADVCRWVIDNADRILCQTERQQTLLRERFGRDGTIVRNPIDVDRWTEAMAGPVPFPELESLTNYALWVGRADPVHKRPQLLIELVKLCPDVPFVMVLNPRDDPTEAEVRRTAPGNVSIIRSVPFDQMPTLFARAAVLVNTSSLEGFPNTYLQAAISKVPVASLVVEDEFLQQSNGGICTRGDLAKLASYIQNCAGDHPFPADMEHARTFVAKEFGLKEQAKRLASELRQGTDARPNS